MRKTVKLPSFSGVGASQTAHLDLPRIGTYAGLRLYFEHAGAAATVANMKSFITNIRLLLNGVVAQEFSYTQLEAINAYFGLTAQDGWIEIPFGYANFRTPGGEVGTFWGMQDVASFQIEVEIGAATNPTLAAYGRVIDRPSNLGSIIQIRKYNLSPSGTGEIEVQKLPLNMGAFVAIHHQTANISNVRVIVDGAEKINATRDLIGYNATIDGSFSQQAGWTQLGFVDTALLEDALPVVGVDDFRVIPNMSVATPHDILVQTVGPLNGRQ